MFVSYLLYNINIKQRKRWLDGRKKKSQQKLAN